MPPLSGTKMCGTKARERPPELFHERGRLPTDLPAVAARCGYAIA